MYKRQVQGAQRLVEKQDLRLIDQAAGDGHALLLAAGHPVSYTHLDVYKRQAYYNDWSTLAQTSVLK